MSGIILAHAHLARSGRLRALIPSYAAQLPGLALVLAGVVFLAELAFRLQAVRNGAAAGQVLGLPADPQAPWQWLVGVAVFAAGALLLRRSWPTRAGGVAGADGGRVVTPALSIRDLRKSFGATSIIKGVTLDTRAGRANMR